MPGEWITNILDYIIESWPIGILQNPIIDHAADFYYVLIKYTHFVSFVVKCVILWRIMCMKWDRRGIYVQLEELQIIALASV